MALHRLYSQAIAPAAGTANTNLLLDPLDLSRAKALVLELILTGAATDAGDTLNIYFQEASDDVTPTWNDRAAFPQFIGTATVSAAAPEKHRLQIPCQGFDFAAGERSYEPSGSAGAAHITASTVVAGPMLGKRRTAANGLVARHRLHLVQVDASADAEFTGVVNIYIDSFGA